MTAERKKLLQVILLMGIVTAGLRLAYIAYQRHQANRASEQPKAAAFNPDDYVTPKRLHAYDLASAREITKLPAWVKEGYRYTYYPYDPGRHRADLRKPAGTLDPIEKVDFTDVVTQPTPGDPGSKQVIAVFRKGSGQFAVPVGIEQSGSFQINFDEMFFVQDPRQLYNHWPKEVWDAIAQHQVKPGMNEIQAVFAIGMGIPEPGTGTGKTVNYPNGGNPVQITYKEGRAVVIKPGKSPAQS
jgi:hypothetical protein